MRRLELSQGVFVGFDVGSSAVHWAVLDPAAGVLDSPGPIMHMGNPMGAVLEAWSTVCDRFGREGVLSTSFTGSGAVTLRDLDPGALYVYDSVAIPFGVGMLVPDARYIFHIGAKDAYFFEVTTAGGRQVIRQWCTGTKCGGGSGTLIEKQCRRLFQGQVRAPVLDDPGQYPAGAAQEAVRVANRGRLQVRMETMLARAQTEASNATDPSEFLARCGVVIQSDLIHKQNEGATRADNLAGLFRTIARNYKIDVLGSRRFEEIDGRAVATGGVMANALVLDHLMEILGIRIDRPDAFQNAGAVGAAAKALEKGNRFVLEPSMLDRAARQGRQQRAFVGPLREALALVHDRREFLNPEIPAGTEVVIGIDGGSTTTKGVLVDLATGGLLDKLYIKTHGNPEASLKQVLRYLGRHRDRVVVRGVGATGSARKLHEKILISQARAGALTESGTARVDRITDEITCHALGVRHFDPRTDTIFEIGGQDMKYTRFGPDGTVQEAKMNYSCQAGSGQTLENMADLLDLCVEDSLQEAALRADRVPIIDSTCGVFMEMDENRLVAEGFSTDEIAAAIVRGTAACYYYKFVGGSQPAAGICSAQGGPPLGIAFLAALAQVANRPIEAYPHREIFGAWGQALDIVQAIRDARSKGQAHDTAFRGWDVVDMHFAREHVSCRCLFGDKSCGMRDCRLERFRIEDDEILTGGFCPLGNSESAQRPKTNYVDLYHRVYEKHFRRQGLLLSDLTEQQARQARVIGIRRSTATLGEKGIWAAALLRELGFLPAVSPRSDGRIAQKGVDQSRTEFCIARKLATGHAAVLHEHPLVEYLFNPSFIEHRQEQGPALKYCIYTESEGYVLNDVLGLDQARQINPALHFNDTLMLVEELRAELERVGLPRGVSTIRRALSKAEEAEAAFKQELYEAGDRFLGRVEKEGRPAYVGIGRDYVLLDPEASSGSGAMFSRTRGLDYIPQIFLEHRFLDRSLDGITSNEFWVESVKILKAHLFVAGHPRLFGIRLMNFACGPDSLKIYQERTIQEAAGKPLLVLVTDGQTNAAPFVTRTEAHERVVNQSRPKGLDLACLKRPSPNHRADRTWLIPFMGHASDVAAAGARCFGIDCRVLPTHTPRGHELARKHIWTEVCHPLKGVLGDSLGFLMDQIDRHGKAAVCARYAILLPTTSGPCRFGKYTELVRHFLDAEDLADVPVLGPSSETDYLDVPFPRRVSATERMRFQQVLFKGMYAQDLLEDAYRRFRPYVRDTGQVDALRGERLDALIRIVEQGAAMEELLAWGRQTMAVFKACPVRTAGRFPLVLYIGEIYMRMHDPYTDHVIDRLEAMDLELVRDPMTEWLDYTNQTQRTTARRDMRMALRYGRPVRVLWELGRWGRSVLKGRYMAAVKRTLGDPFRAILADRHVLPGPAEMIETLRRAHEWHPSIEGESPLTTGIAYHLMRGLTRTGGRGRIAGIFHVGPFTCMQEGVATAKIEAMVQAYRRHQPEVVLPMLHAFFGDSANPNLDAEIAVFREQCSQEVRSKRQAAGPRQEICPGDSRASLPVGAAMR